MARSKSLEAINLDNLSEQDIYYVATALLYTLKNNQKYKITSELFYLLDYKNFINLIKYFGGEIIRIPSQDELSDILKLLMVHQVYYIEKKPWKMALEKAGYSEEDSKAVARKLDTLEKQLEGIKIGNRKYR